MTPETLLPPNNQTVEFMSNNTVRIKYHTEKGSTVKTISFNDYCDAIIAARNALPVNLTDGPTVDSPIFPVAGNVATVQYREFQSGAKTFVMLRKDDPFDINYRGTIFKQVGLPKMLFAVKLLNNVIQGAAVVCVTDHVVNENSDIYSFPLGNASMEGKICFGANRIASFDIKETQMLHSVPNMFLSMEGNDDHYGKNLSRLAQRPMLNELQGKPFPVEWLKPMGKKYKQWFETLH